MRGLKFALIFAAVACSSSGMACVQLRMAQTGLFTVEDAYGQMGGLPFQLAALGSGPSDTLAQLEGSR